jgi:hypothetical protein
VKRKPLQELEPDAAAWVGRLCDEAAKIRLPELFRDEREGSLYRVADRHGVGVVALPTPCLTRDELVALLRFRLAQYLDLDFMDGRLVYKRRLEHEPFDGVAEGDVHIVAGSPETGELFCYTVLRAPPDTPPGTRMRDRDRPLFPVEEVHGWGIYQRLRILPDLPVAKVWEAGRFVRNQRLRPLADVGVRAPVEALLGMCRLVVGPIRLEIEALVGDFEETRAKQNLHFFHVPLVVLHGTVPYEPESALMYPRYRYCTVYPFALLGTDALHARPRMDAVEHGLSQPGTHGLIELMQEKAQEASTPSSLEPPDGLAAIAEVTLPQQGVPMEARRELLGAGARLRLVPAFAGLSDAESAILGSLLERVEAGPGDTIVRQGDEGDALYLIEAGEVDVVRRAPDGAARVVDRLGAGDYFGEIAILTGSGRIADVVAATPVVLRRLDREDYVRYLGQLADVEQELTRTALSRASAAARDATAGDG